MEIFVGLVHAEHKLFLWQEENWPPHLAGTDSFTMVDMLIFVGELNPDGVAPQPEPEPELEPAE